MVNYNDFFDKQIIEKSNNFKIEKIFQKLNWKYKINKDLQLQKLGIDYFCKSEYGRMLIDIKFQQKKYNHETEMLIEMNSFWNDSGSLYKKGWIIDEELETTHLIDYCIETGEWYVYDYTKFREWAKDVVENNDFPEGSYKRTVKNKYMHTEIVMVPRKEIEKFLVIKGKK